MTNESLITGGGARETPSGQDNVTEPLEAGYQNYENSTLEIKTQYPSNWKVEGLTDSVRFISPKEDTNDNYIQTVDLFTYPSISLNQAVESLSIYYNTSLTNFTIIGSPHASVGANSSSVSFLYSFNEGDIGSLRAMDFIVSPEGNDNTYLFTFRDEATRFERDLPELQRMLNSVNFFR